MRGGGGIEAAGGWGGEGIEVLCYGVINGGAGEADEVYKLLEKG